MRKAIQTLLLLTSITALGQETIKINGRLISKNDNYIIGAVIILNGTNVGTVSDACGEFSIAIPKDLEGQLNISFFSNPSIFKLSRLKDQDLNKTIILRDYSLDDKRKDKKRKRNQYNIDHSCKDKIKSSLSFNINQNH